MHRDKWNYFWHFTWEQETFPQLVDKVVYKSYTDNYILYFR